MTNVSVHAQRMDSDAFRDVKHKTEQAVRPPALLRNHLHGSDMFIRNQLSNTDSTNTVPPKFQRSFTTPSSSSNDSDYFSTSSRGSATPFAHTNITSPDLPYHVEVPAGIDYPLTSPTTVLSHSAGGYHIRSSNSQHFSLSKHTSYTNRRPRPRRRHSSNETSPTDVVGQINMQCINGVPSRPQSSASNTQEHVVSNCLNRHKSYYEAVNNAAVTSQTIFSHPSERIQTLSEEMLGSNDTETSTLSNNHTVCANGINLEMVGQSQDDIYYHSHDHQQSQWDRILSQDSFHYSAQSDSELVTSSPRSYPRRQTIGAIQAGGQSNKQMNSAHPRLLNSINPISPLAQHGSPKQHHQFDSAVQYSPPLQHNRHRHFSYDANHAQQANGR